MGSRVLAFAVAALSLVAGVAALVLPRPPATGGPDATRYAADLEGRVREAAAGVHSRVATLADLPRLASAVATDSTTVRDLTQEELSFRPRAGEQIAIGQVAKAGGKETVLLTLPDGVKAPSLARGGAHLSLRGDALAVTEVQRIAPKARADELDGAIAVSGLVEVAPLAAQLDAAGLTGTLVLPDGKLPLGKRAAAPGDVEAPADLSGAASQGAKLVVSGPPAPAGLPLQPIGGGIAVVGLLVAVLLFRASARTTSPAKLAGAGKAAFAATSLATLAAAPAEPARSANHIGRYEIVRRLGAGGMAEVFVARATGEAGFEKLVALKVLQKEFAIQPMVVEHFLDEARLASRLIHPNIVQIDDLGRAGDEYFIAMELVDGADLDRLLEVCRRRGIPVPLRVALAVLRKICDGLHAAHIAVGADGKPLELVHRDVKSANVFVAKNGVVKVGDFGIAKAMLPSRVHKTEVGVVKGTAAYMAPEHRLGEAIDRRADLYALGAIAYEILTGQAVNLDLVQLLAKGRDGWPHLKHLPELRPDLPAALDAIVFRCLAYDRDARYPDCAALEEALEQVANQAGQVASEKQVAQWVEQVLAAEAAPGAGARGAS